MIYVATGTHPAPCERLAVLMDDWAVEQGEEVLFQGSKPSASFRRVRHVELLTPQAHRDTIQRARVVVTHAGPATIMDVLEQGKVPLVVPRDPAHGEHVDDHQLRFAQRLGDEVRVVNRLEDLHEHLRFAPEVSVEVMVDRQARSDEVAKRVGEVVVDLVARRARRVWWRRWLARALLGSA